MNYPLNFHITWSNVHQRCIELAEKIAIQCGSVDTYLPIYGIPTGGFHISNAVVMYLRALGYINTHAVETVTNGETILVDDLVDSGETRNRWNEQFPGCKFYTAFNKQTDDRDRGKWLSFPWERGVGHDGPEDNIRRILQFIGEDPSREGLSETPARVVKSYKEIFSGYTTDLAGLMKCFEEPTCDEMVLLKDIEFYSVCEHHMQPFFGKAHVAYVPNGRVIGVSKLSRVVDAFSRRLQVQERLTQQVTKALDEHLRPRGSACIMEARHFCMVCRGVRKQNASMVTSSLTGCFLEPTPRAELFNLIRG